MTDLDDDGARPFRWTSTAPLPDHVETARTTAAWLRGAGVILLIVTATGSAALGTTVGGLAVIIPLLAGTFGALLLFGLASVVECVAEIALVVRPVVLRRVLDDHAGREDDRR